MSDDAKVQAIRARREYERDLFRRVLDADKAGDRVLATQLLNDSAGRCVDYEADVDFLLDALAQAERERDAAVAALDELAAWVGYGDWHHASPELARKVYAVLGKRDYLPRYTWDDDAPAGDA